MSCYITDKLLVLGNGPSLKKEYFRLFKDIPCLGMNAAYRYWQRIGWYPDIYCCLDDQVVLTHADAIAKMIDRGLCKHFFLHQNFLQRFPDFVNAPNVYFLPQLMHGSNNAELCKKLKLNHLPQPQFLSTRPNKLTTGSYAVRFANFLGFRKIGLVGIDARYVEIINEAKIIDGIVLEISSTPKNNPNYFFDDYQISGDRYNIPNPAAHKGNLHLQAFEALRDDIDKYKLDLDIYICTPESELYDKDVFPYIPLVDFLGKPKLSAIFVPFVKKDVDQLVYNLKIWGCQSFAPYRDVLADPHVELHFAYNGKPDATIEEILAEAYDEAGLFRYFNGFYFHYSYLEGLHDLYTRRFEGPVGPEGYMAGPNNQFFDIISKFSIGMSHIILLEADVIPIRPNWLAVIESIVEGSDRFWVCGSHYRGTASLIQYFFHINGNAIYHVGDPDFQKFFNETFVPYFYERVKTMPSLCYDIVLHDLFRSLFSGNPDAAQFKLWTEVVHRFRMSEYIVNRSHKVDHSDNLQLTLEEARRTYPDAYLFHGAIKKIKESIPSPLSCNLNNKISILSKSRAVSIVMIDPDALGNFGHYLAYDDQLDQALEPYDVSFQVLANRKLPNVIAKSRKYFSPCMTDHSWVLGVPNCKTQKVDPAALSRFENEVLEFLNDWYSNCDAIRLYMYCAGIPHAQAIARVIDRFPNATAVVNLFYLPFQPIHTQEFARHWLPVLQELICNTRLILTVPTDTLASELQSLYNIELSVTPHPSPTISDSRFALLQNSLIESPPRADDRPVVLFPSAPTPGKGSDLVVATANYLVQEKTKWRVIVRDIREKATSSHIAKAYDELSPHVEKVQGQLSNEEFLSLIRSVDIVVLPYTPDMFKYRNSGLLVDAIYCGKPVVAVKDTWLGKLIEKTGCGIAVNELTPAALGTAISTIAEDLKKFCQRARIAARAYYVNNSWDVLARLLCVPIATQYDRKKSSVSIPKDNNNSNKVVNIGSPKLKFSYESSPYFLQISPNQWRYTHMNTGKKLWIAVIDIPSKIAGREFIGGLQVKSSCLMTVRVTLGRHGKTDYEGAAIDLKLMPNETRQIRLKKFFNQSHSALKLQIEVLEMESANNALLTINNLFLYESVASIFHRFEESNITLHKANKLLRDGDVCAAMAMYLALYQKRSLQIYADNALMAARWLGMSQFSSVEQLMQQIGIVA